MLIGGSPSQSWPAVDQLLRVEDGGSFYLCGKPLLKNQAIRLGHDVYGDSGHTEDLGAGLHMMEAPYHLPNLLSAWLVAR